MAIYFNITIKHKLNNDWQKAGVDMQAYAYKLTMGKSGVLTIKNLPFNNGEKLEIIIIPKKELKHDKNRYPFWGKPIAYINPTDPISEVDWEALK